jgi:hypothetical protein
LDVECPFPERLRTGCCPDEECLGLLRLVLQEQLALPELAPQVQQGPQPLALLVLLETELMRLEQLGLQVPPERPEPVLPVQQVQQVLVQPEQPSAQPLLA